MAKQSIVLLNNTSDLDNFTGQKQKAAGFYGSSQGKHTIAVYLNNFSGRLYIEATLASDPEESDWFPVVLSGQPEDYVEFPVDSLNPTDPLGPGDSGVVYFTFQGNYVWLRARIDRSYQMPVPTPKGSIGKILLNY